MTTTTKEKKQGVLVEPVVEMPGYRNRDIRQTMRRRRCALHLTYRDLSRDTLGDPANNGGVHEAVVSKFCRGKINANVRTTVGPLMRAMDMFLYYRGHRSTDCVAMLLWAADQQGMAWSKAFRLSGYSPEWASKIKVGKAPNVRLGVIQHLAQTLGVVGAY